MLTLSPCRVAARAIDCPWLPRVAAISPAQRRPLRRIAQPGAQGIGVEPGQRQQPPRPLAVAQHPAERRERQRLGVCGGLRFAENCRSLVQRLGR